MSGSTACFNVLNAEGEKHGLNIATFNPLSCFNNANKLADIRSSAGLSIWREGEAVHLTAATYNDIAAVLTNQAENNGKQPLTGQVRRQLASVIPTATTVTPSIREPAWISRELRSAMRQPARRTAWRLQRRTVGRPGAEPMDRARHYPY